MTYAGNNELSEWIKINNAYEYQSMTGRLLETARKGNWNPSEETLNSLVKEYTETVVENGVTCCHHTCGNPLLDDFVQGIMSVPGVVDERTAMQYKRIMEEATNEPEKEITYRRSGSSGSSSSKKQNANEVMAINSNQTVELQAGAGADLSQQASKTPKSTPDNYVEGYEMKKEVIAQPENSNKFSGSDIVIFLLVAGAVGAVFLGFRRKGTCKSTIRRSWRIHYPYADMDLPASCQINAGKNCIRKCGYAFDRMFREIRDMLQETR